MGTKTNKKETKPITGHIYGDESVKNYSFFDFVRVRTGKNGSLLSFGKSHPESDKFTVYQEILIPLEIGLKLGEIITNQFKELEASGQIKIERSEMEDEGRGGCEDE